MFYFSGWICSYINGAFLAIFSVMFSIHLFFYTGVYCTTRLVWATKAFSMTCLFKWLDKNYRAGQRLTWIRVTQVVEPKGPLMVICFAGTTAPKFRYIFSCFLDLKVTKLTHWKLDQLQFLYTVTWLLTLDHVEVGDGRWSWRSTVARYIVCFKNCDMTRPRQQISEEWRILCSPGPVNSLDTKWKKVNCSQRQKLGMEKSVR